MEICYILYSFASFLNKITSDGASYRASGALPLHSLAFDIIHRYSYSTFSFKTFSKS